MNMVILGPAHYVAFDTEHTNTSVALISGRGTAQPIGLMRQQKAGMYLRIIPRRGFGSLDRGTRTSLHTCVGAAVNLGSIIAAKYAVGASLNQITGPAL